MTSIVWVVRDWWWSNPQYLWSGIPCQAPGEEWHRVAQMTLPPDDLVRLLAWCADTFGPCGVEGDAGTARWRYDKRYGRFSFAHEQDYVLIRLAFSGPL